MKYIQLKSRRYLGNKFSLLPTIDEIIRPISSEIESVVDIFAGTGVVGEYFLQKGKDTIFNDLLYSNKVIYECWFGKAKYNEEKIRKLLLEYNDLKSEELPENYFSKNFKDTYFSHGNCKKIGFIREGINQMLVNNVINKREYYILISALLYSMDRISNTVGHYDSYLLSEIGLKEDLKLYHPKIKEYKNQKISIYNEDANKLCREIKSDLVYIDPPYNSRQYSDLYHLLENVAEWKKPMVQFKAKKMDRSHIKSEYSLNSATKTFEDLIENLDTRYILVSYNNMGDGGNGRSNAKIKDEDLFRILKNKGEVEVIEKEYRHFTTGKSRNTDIKERFFLCKTGSR